MTTTTEGDHLGEASSVAIFGTSANSRLASSTLVALFGGAGLLLSNNPIQRLMFLGCFVASILTLQWASRQMGAVLREDDRAAEAWEKLLIRTWQAQLFCCLAAGLSVAIGGLTLPGMPSGADGLLKEPLSQKELKQHERPRPLAHLQPATVDGPRQEQPGFA